MKRLLHRIKQSIDSNGRDWTGFLLALLLAFSIWLIHNLSLNYTEYIQVPVLARCNIEGHASMSSNRCDVVARCRTSGYSILLTKLYSGSKPKIVDFNRSSMHHKVGDLYYLTAGDMQEYVHVIFGDIVSLDYFLTDTLFFRFPYESHKRVPVCPVQILEFEPQYMSQGGINIEPDSVTVYGEPAYLENIDRVYTEPVKLSGINSNVHGVVKIEKIKGIRLSEGSAHYSINVSRYVEIPAEIKVAGRNVPPDKEFKIYPSTASVVMRCIFPLAGNAADLPVLYVDYNDFASSLSGRCVLKIGDMPAGVIDIKAEPQIYECVVNEK